MRGVFWILLATVAVSASAKHANRIVGGSVTTINRYPDMAALLFLMPVTGFRFSCGGTIINNRSILSAAHCTITRVANEIRVRLGSTYSTSGGVIFDIGLVINHHQYNQFTFDNDISILRVQGNIFFSNVIQQGFIAGPSYYVPDNAVVWATGWGTIFEGGPWSEALREVQIYTVNQEICRQRYATTGMQVTDNMLCSGVLDVGGRDQCLGDSGGPLYHNGVIVGVCSWGASCAHPFFPGVNARVQRYAGWISQNV